MPVDSIAAPSTECLDVAAIGATTQIVGIRMTMIMKEIAKSMTSMTSKKTDCNVKTRSELRKRTSQSGSVILEFALILPVFVFVGLMLVDLQWLTRDAAALEYITTETARCEAIDSPACSAPNSAESYALKLARDLRLTDDVLKLQTPPCNLALSLCTVSATYEYKPLGAYFPKMTIARSGSASTK